IVVSGRGTVSSKAGTCAATGPPKSCTQDVAARTKVTLTATPRRGSRFTGWGGSCKGSRPTCTFTVTTAPRVTATFSRGGLASAGAPVVREAAKGFEVTLRFRATAAGLAHVTGLRAGRVAASLSLRVGSGATTIGPFPVARPGLYTFR